MRTDHPVTVGILADDLTSAADGAAPFVGRGWQAVIGRARLPHQTRPVVAVDGGMRALGEAAAGVRAAALAAQLAGQSIFYKTVDSTLRGHVRVEIEAAFGASGRSSLVFAPAFPAAGRTTVDGVQLVHGIPVTATQYGSDPVHPARHSKLADLLPPGIAAPTILDAATQDELDQRIAAIPNPETVFWVGSPGMAAALARRTAPGPRPATPDGLTDPAIDAVTGDILVVIGTANACSHDQAAALDGLPGVTVLRSPVPREADPAAVLDRIVAKAATQLSHGGIAAVIATGGETMEAILGRLGVYEFEILREFEPGFPLGRVGALRGPGLLIAMKAGGFGGRHTLRRAIAQLRRAHSSLEQEPA